MSCLEQHFLCIKFSVDNHPPLSYFVKDIASIKLYYGTFISFQQFELEAVYDYIGVGANIV